MNDAVQKRTDKGSMVSKVAPTASIGVTLKMRIIQKPARELTSRAMKRSIRNRISAAITGEKKRMPNWLSPHNAVPRNCVYAIIGGLE